MNPVDIIKKYYDPAGQSFEILLRHSTDVTEMALEVAQKTEHLALDIDLIKEGAMLHDIGIFMTNAPALGCYGKNPYISHGYLGRKLLEDMGFYKHGLICERHVGVGITLDDVIRQNLPLPLRDMTPVSFEEKIICYADKFFSKDKNMRNRKKTIKEIEQSLNIYGYDKVVRFRSFVKLFNLK